MGYISHHAIVVVGYSEHVVRKTKQKAKIVFSRICGENDAPPITNIVKSPLNGYASFMIGPDGSKEGWYPSNKGDEARAEFTKWLDENKSCNYVVISMPEDDSPTISQHN